MARVMSVIRLSRHWSSQFIESQSFNERNLNLTSPFNLANELTCFNARVLESIQKSLRLYKCVLQYQILRKNKL